MTSSSNNNNNNNNSNSSGSVTDVFLGIFKKKEKTRKSSSIFGSKKKSKTKSSITTNETVPPRRVVKASQPPKISPNDQEEDKSKNQVENDDDVALTNSNSGGLRIGKVKDVEDEAQRENTEKWRKERMEASAAIRKEMKEKEVTEHRTQPKKEVDEKTTTTTTTTTTTNADTSKEEEEMPAILSVASQFPEHKRTVNEASLPVEEEPSIKKSRVEEGEDLSLVEKKNYTSKYRWLYYVVPVAAAIGVWSLKYLRKRV